MRMKDLLSKVAALEAADEQKRTPHRGVLLILYGYGLCLGHLTGLQAAGAYPGLANMTAVVADGDLLNIRTERPVADPV